MPNDSDAFEQSPEYFASIIVALLRHFGHASVKLTATELKETAPLGLHIHGVKDEQAIELVIVSNPDAPQAVEEFVGLDYASSPLPDRSKLN